MGYYRGVPQSVPYGARKRRILDERARRMRERYGCAPADGGWQTSAGKREQMAAYSRAWRRKNAA
jgi:hypothetical protein